MTRLTFEYDPEPYGKERDGAIIKMAQQFGVETVVRNSHTLYNLDRWGFSSAGSWPPGRRFVTCSLCLLAPRIVEMNNNSPPLTFKRFQTIVSRLELPRRPLPSVTQQQMSKCGATTADKHEQLYGIPSLEDLGERRHPSSTSRGHSKAGGGCKLWPGGLFNPDPLLSLAC